MIDRFESEEISWLILKRLISRQKVNTAWVYWLELYHGSLWPGSMHKLHPFNWPVIGLNDICWPLVMQQSWLDACWSNDNERCNQRVAPEIKIDSHKFIRNNSSLSKLFCLTLGCTRTIVKWMEQTCRVVVQNEWKRSQKGSNWFSGLSWHGYVWDEQVKVNF